MHEVIDVGYVFQTYTDRHKLSWSILGKRERTFKIVEHLVFKHEDIFVFVLLFNFDGHVLL